MSTFGSNLGYVDELWARYRRDPESVSEAWREFFADYRPPGPSPSEAAAPSEPATPATAPAAPDRDVPTWRADEDDAPADGAQALRGVAGRIVENMTRSLAVPTATSIRTVPVKLLEENRRVVNQHQAMIAGPKISFTHVLAWGLTRALERHPDLNAGFQQVAGTPYRLPRPAVHLGIAIDVERKGERSLLVPNIRNAERLDFPSFVAAYDDLVARARAGRLGVDDFAGTTVTLTNPGMIGTAMSVPRLMAGQGAIFGVGAIGYPAEYSGMSPEVLAGLGISKVMTVTSTYDHRVVQGAESGAFLATLERLLLGGDGFYTTIFRDLGVPHEPLTWSGDTNPRIGIAGAGSSEAIEKQAAVVKLIRAYRVRGHLWADLDPLGYAPRPVEELELSHHGLTVWDLDRGFIATDLAGGSPVMPLREILDTLRETYCRHVGVEFLHIPEPGPRTWLQSRMEQTRNTEPLEPREQRAILAKLNAAEAFERFLHTAYIGHKRFSLEGAETLVPTLDALLTEAAEAGVEHAVIGMAHRGRLNVLANVVGMSYDRIFRRFEGDLDPRTPHGTGDVIYHLGFDGEHVTPSGRKAVLTLASNPSHLEAVDPVVEGMARALQDRAGDVERERVLPILVHGDGALAGQGVVAETLNLSQLKGYRTGGTVHIVVNNQIGFTTGPADLRSSLYCTDVGKIARAPIFHVNGDHPEDAVRVIRLAFAFRQMFKRDVVVDVVCYRRWGHNETDDPSYTNPVMYAKIEGHRSVRKLYTEQLLRRGDLDPEAAERALEDFRERLQQVHDEVTKAREREDEAPPDDADDRGGEAGPTPDTSTSRDVLLRILDGLERAPAGFRVHPKLRKQLDRRPEMFEGGRIDWALAEAFAFGSLVLEGRPVRLSGEDSGRGTFSQRHAILYDHETGESLVPLDALDPEQGRLMVHDSLLSEFAVLGFEYGYSVARPDALVMWEAQFGDFVNGAQVVVDQFVVSAEAKWGQRSGLVLLLPHGSEGQGPEHSSARLERFLQQCAGGNIQVAVPSTPAQYFHLLRRQARPEIPRPLIALTPKSLLRHRECVSTAEELVDGRFREILDDPDPPAGDARRVVLCCGKVYYDLVAHRREVGVRDVALVRVEQPYPWPGERLESLLATRYGACREILWVQEEPRNMGAWTFVRDRLDGRLGSARTLAYCGRARAASPAAGSLRRHHATQRRILDAAFAPEVDAPTKVG